MSSIATGAPLTAGNAGTDHGDEPIVLAAKDADDLLPGARHGQRPSLSQRQLVEEDGGWEQRPVALDVEVARLHGAAIVPGPPPAPQHAGGPGGLLWTRAATRRRRRESASGAVRHSRA